MVVIIGSIYAIPNLYPTQPSIQVAYTDSGKSADQALLNELENILKKASEDDIQNKPSYIEADEETKATMVLENAYDEIFLRENKIVIKFNDVDSQLSSKTLLQNNLLDKVIIALFLEPSTPKWLKNIGANPVKLGLDLSGGVHFLLEVDIDTAQQGRLELLLDTYRNTFKDERIRFDKSSIEDLALYFQFSNKDSYNKALKKYREDSIMISGDQYIITERPSPNVLILQYSDLALKEIRDYAVGQNLTTWKNRTNELGVTEQTVQYASQTTASWDLTLENTALLETNASIDILGVSRVSDGTSVPWYVGMTASNFTLQGKGKASIAVTIVYPEAPDPGMYQIDLVGIDVDNGITYPYQLYLHVLDIPEFRIEYDYTIFPVHPVKPTNLSVRV